MLTKRQKEVLDFIKTFSQKKEYSPSLEEIQQHFKFASVSTAHFHVSKLIVSGRLEKSGKHARAIAIPQEQPRLISIPLLGVIAAGGPIEAIVNIEEITVPGNMISDQATYYALQVTGTSMIEEGISDGDIVVIRKQRSVHNGEKAVAYLPDQNTVTLKKIYREKNRIKLVPANKYMKPFYENNVEIQGKVVGVLRKE